MTRNKRSLGFILFSFLVGLTLLILPLSNEVQDYNPQWLVLIAAYWGIAAPEKAGILMSWIWGLFLDVSIGTYLGIHALSLALVSYMAIILHQRLRMYPMWQQSLFIWLLAGLDKLVVLQLNNVLDTVEVQWNYWYSTFSTALLWPVVFLLLKKFRPN